MNEKSKKSLIRIAMLLIGVLCSFLLVFAVYKLVSPEVFYSDEQRAQAALQALVGGQEVAPVTDRELLENVSELYAAPNGAYIVQTTTLGLEGDVVLRVGVAADGTVSGISCVSHSETPEIGGAALQKGYLSTYIGAASSEGIDSYTGATFTSDAVREAVDLAVMQYKVCNGIEIGQPEPEVPVEEAVPAAAEMEPVVEEAAPAVEEPTAEEAAEGEEKVYEVSSKGYSSDIVLAVTVAPDGTVSNIEVISNNETPALGGKALKGSYLSTYCGASSTEGIDAFAGASFTSAAIRDCVDQALAQFRAGK